MIYKTKGITLTLVLALIINMLCLPGIFVSADASYSADYEPINPNAIFMAYDNNAKLAVRLSWVNPKADTLKEVKIYGDSTYGENKFDTLIDTVSDPTPGAVSVYDVKQIGGADLEQGKYYTYRLVYEFDDRQTEIYVSSIATKNWCPRFLRGSTDNQSQVYITGSQSFNMPGWTQKIVKDGNDEYLNLSANVDSANGWGNISLVIGNKDGKITKGTDYNVKITYKSDSDINWGSFAFKQSENWTDVTQKITSDGNGVSIAYSGVKSFYNLCIKSVEVYNTADNSLVDSYDCSIYNKTPQPVSGIVAGTSGNDVNFAIAASPSWWWNDGDDKYQHLANYYNIYEVIDDKKVFRATFVRQGLTTTSIEGMLHNVSVGTHKYAVTCSDDTGLESEPVETTAEVVDVHELSNLSAKPYRISSYAVGMDVSWTNPVADTLSKVTLYRVDTDGDTLIHEYTNPESAETVTYKDANLETNKNYSYKVVCSFTDHSDVEGTMNGYLDLDVKEFVAEYHPKNMAAVQYGTGSGKVGITLSWINPCVKAISGITVSRMDEGGEVLLTDNLDLTPEKVVEYTDFGVESDMHTYKIKFDFPDHMSGVYYTSASASDGEFRKLIRGVNIAGVYSKTKIVPGITSRVVKDGDNRYMRLTVNVPEGDTERGAYFGMNSQNVLNAEQTYTFKMKVKTEEAADITLKCGDMSRTVGTERVPADGKWHEVSATFTAPYKTSTVMAVFDGSVLGMSIDDIVISGTDGELDHFNFDEYDLIPAPPGTLDVSVSKNSATAAMSISKDWWWSQDAGFDKLARTIVYYNVYEKTEDGAVLRAKLCRPNIQVTSMSAIIDDLMFGSEYNFFATTEDNYGILESEPIYTKFKTESEPDNVEISDFSVRTSDGEAVDSVKSGTCTISTEIGNYTANEFKAQLIVAVYKANKLVKLYGTDITNVESSKGNKPITQLKISNADMSGLSGDDCTMDVMLWSGIDTMKILKGVKTFKVINN